MFSAKEYKANKKTRETQQDETAVPAGTRTRTRRAVSAGARVRDVRIAYHPPEPVQDGAGAGAAAEGPAVPSVTPAGIGRGRPLKLVCVNHQWYPACRPQTVEETEPVTDVPNFPNRQTGDTYEPETGQYVHALDNLVHMFERIDGARRRTAARRERHVPPRIIQEAFARTSMNGYCGKNYLPYPGLSGQSLKFTRGFARKAGTPKEHPEHQPFLHKPEGVSTRYSSLTATLAKDLDPLGRLTLSTELTEYDKSPPDRIHSAPNLFAGQPKKQEAADLLSGLTLAESHSTRALDDGGKTMRAAVRAMGVLGPQRVFGVTNAIMVICRKGGNAMLRSLQENVARYKALHQRPSTQLSEPDRSALTQTEQALRRDGGEDFAVLDGYYSDPSEDEMEAAKPAKRAKLAKLAKAAKETEETEETEDSQDEFLALLLATNQRLREMVHAADGSAAAPPPPPPEPPGPQTKQDG